MRIDILEFQGSGRPEELLDWINAIEEVFEYKEVPENKLVSLLQLDFVEEQQLGGNKLSSQGLDKAKRRLILGKS